MCTVGQRFTKPDAYQSLGCDYFIFDSVIPTATGLSSSEDEHAWKLFKSVSWTQQPKPEFGISFPGRYATDLPTALSSSVTNELKQLFAKGYRSFGVLNCHGTVSFLSGTTGTKFGELFNTIFNAMTAAQRDAGLKTFFIGLQASYGVTTLSDNLMHDVIAIRHLNLLIMQSHIVPLPPLTASNCHIYPSSSWSQAPIVNDSYSSVERASALLYHAPSTRHLQAFAISFSMAVNMFAISSSPSFTNTRFRDSCITSAVTSLNDICLLPTANVVTQTNSTESVQRGYVTGKRFVFSYSTAENMAELYNKSKVNVQASKKLGILLADIQFDYTYRCSGGPLTRVKYMRDFLNNLRRTTTP